MEIVLVRHALPDRRVDDWGSGRPAARRARASSKPRPSLSGSPKSRSMRSTRQSDAPRARDRGRRSPRTTSSTILVEDGIAEYDRQSEVYIPIEEVKRSDDPEMQAHWKALAEDRLEDLIEDAHTFRPRVAEAVARLDRRAPRPARARGVPRRRDQRRAGRGARPEAQPVVRAGVRLDPPRGRRPVTGSRASSASTRRSTCAACCSPRKPGVTLPSLAHKDDGRCTGGAAPSVIEREELH